MGKMKLTKAENEVMLIIWEMERGLVSDMIEKLPDPKPPHSTISSIVRILEKKGFVGHKAYGRTHEYFPLVSKDDYSRNSIQQLASDYFGGSMNRLVSFIAEEEDLDLKQIGELLNRIEKES
jgi:predicted transcriptional regulator